VDALVHRGELAALELAEARQYGVRTVLISVISVAFVLLAGTAATFAVAAAVWDRPDRGMILSLLALGYFTASVLFALVAARRLRDWQPFAETARQLREDCACIQEIVNDATR
jgi:uncharacterized membrane protein YqjE